MPTYNVHLYVSVRVPVRGVAADSPRAAIAVAESSANLHQLLDGRGFSYAEASVAAMVDVLRPGAKPQDLDAELVEGASVIFDVVDGEYVEVTG